MGRSFATRRWFAHRITAAWAVAVAWAAFGLVAASARASEPTAVDSQVSLVNPAEELLAPLPQPVLEASPLADVAIDDQVTPAGYYESGHYGGSPSRQMQRPINWISGPYIRAGVSLGLGSSLFDSQSTGWTISGGFRNALPPMYDERMFLDFGGSYMSAYGEQSHVFDGNRTVTNSISNTTRNTFITDALRMHLREVKRAGIHAGFGWYWGDTLDTPGDASKLRLATRLGGRISHVRGRFTPEILSTGPNDLVAGESITAIRPVTFGRTDTSGGLYVGTEAILVNRKHDWGTTSWTLDSEFANDWVSFDDFDSGSLGTASITLGWMFSR